MEYSEKVMDHFMNPRNVGEIENASGVGQVGNMKCGDIMKVYLQIEDGKIVDAKFKTFGCGAAVATSSMATELVKGKSIRIDGSGENAVVHMIEDKNAMPLPQVEEDENNENEEVQ